MEAQARATRQTEVARTRRRGAVGKVIQEHDTTLDVDEEIWDSDSCGLSPIKHAAGLFINEGDKRLDGWDVRPSYMERHQPGK